jgi:hypothetical protein
MALVKPKYQKLQREIYFKKNLLNRFYVVF